jgi:hypothetical protein
MVWVLWGIREGQAAAPGVQGSKDVRITCTICQETVRVDRCAAGSMVRCGSCGKSFLANNAEVISEEHKLTHFPVVQVLLLHYATAGLFTAFYLNLMHDKLPRNRRSDPSGFIAVALACIPGVNLIWFFFTYHRLCVRINEQRRFRDLPETAPKVMAVAVAAVLLCGVFGLVLPSTGWVVLGTTYAVLFPVFVALVQASANELIEQEEPLGSLAPA